jgi:hypothetical protein
VEQVDKEGRADDGGQNPYGYLYTGYQPGDIINQ